uniref:Uncharacterized protein n=1 Tax=Bracon brevicornis TaxID=1563983 RepID=A0A6V7LZ34_9HYME
MDRRLAGRVWVATRPSVPRLHPASLLPVFPTITPNHPNQTAPTSRNKTEGENKLKNLFKKKAAYPPIQLCLTDDSTMVPPFPRVVLLRYWGRLNPEKWCSM